MTTPDDATRALSSALRMALAFAEDELERRRYSGLKRYINEAATVVQHLKDALRYADVEPEEPE